MRGINGTWLSPDLISLLVRSEFPESLPCVPVTYTSH